MFNLDAGILEDLEPFLGAVAILIIIFAVWRNHTTRRSQGTQSAGPVVAGQQTDKSILWGIAPHDFGGEIARNLLHLALLPEPTTTTPAKDAPSFDELVERVSKQSRVSILHLTASPPDKAQGAPGGIVFSLRADSIRPSQHHASQAGWDGDRGLYELDEWVETSGRLYNNFGMWAEVTGRELAQDRTDVDAKLWPEKTLQAIGQQNIAAKRLTSVEGAEYLLIEMEPEREPDSGTSSTTTVWVDTAQLLLRKVVAQFSEDGGGTSTHVVAFSYHGRRQKITGPEWVNLDENNVCISEKVCAVEHW